MGEEKRGFSLHRVQGDFAFPSFPSFINYLKSASHRPLQEEKEEEVFVGKQVTPGLVLIQLSPCRFENEDGQIGHADWW